MKKALFTYKKDDNSSSDRIVFKPLMIKEATNTLKDFENPNVKYLTGYELNVSGMDDAEIAKYEKIITEYFEIKFPTIEEFVEQNGLDSKKIQQKSFKKEKVNNLKLL